MTLIRHILAVLIVLHFHPCAFKQRGEKKIRGSGELVNSFGRTGLIFTNSSTRSVTFTRSSAIELRPFLRIFWFTKYGTNDTCKCWTLEHHPDPPLISQVYLHTLMRMLRMMYSCMLQTSQHKLAKCYVWFPGRAALLSPSPPDCHCLYTEIHLLSENIHSVPIVWVVMIFFMPECNVWTNAQEANIQGTQFPTCWSYCGFRRRALWWWRSSQLPPGCSELLFCMKYLCHCSRLVEYFYLKSLPYFVTPWHSPISRCASLRWNSIICVTLYWCPTAVYLSECVRCLFILMCVLHTRYIRGLYEKHIRARHDDWHRRQASDSCAAQFSSVTMTHGLEANRIWCSWETCSSATTRLGIQISISDTWHRTPGKGGESPKICLDVAGHQGTTICVSSSYYNLLYYYISVLFILLLHLYYYIGKPDNRRVPTVHEAARADLPPWLPDGEETRRWTVMPVTIQVLLDMCHPHTIYRYICVLLISD